MFNWFKKKPKEEKAPEPVIEQFIPEPQEPSFEPGVEPIAEDPIEKPKKISKA